MGMKTENKSELNLIEMYVKEGVVYMKYLFYIFIISVFTFTLLTGCATFPGINLGRLELESDDVHVKVAFNDDDRRIIHDYYNKKYKYKKHKDLPPGLAKKKKLPPGLQKQLVRNGTLPAGLAKRHLPAELEEKLPPLPKGYVRLKIGGDIVLLNEKTQVIVDIIYNEG